MVLVEGERLHLEAGGSGPWRLGEASGACAMVEVGQGPLLRVLMSLGAEGRCRFESPVVRAGGCFKKNLSILILCRIWMRREESCSRSQSCRWST